MKSRVFSRRGMVVAMVLAVMIGVGGVYLSGVISTTSAKGDAFPQLTFPPGFPAAKAAILQAQADRETAAPRVDKATLTPPDDQPGSPPTGGIIDAQIGPFPEAAFAVQNAWGGEVGGTWLWVYAGQGGDENPSVGPYGGVALMSQSMAGLVPGTGFTWLGYVVVPGLDAPLTIVSVDGTSMTLSDPEGQTYVFDLASHTFS
jgi:hypothetical protein